MKHLQRCCLLYTSNKSDSVTSQVCAYIDAHYREEIHREKLGELVFLNTDYLSPYAL